MRLGLIGRGPWGQVYAKTLRKMGVDFWQAGSNVDFTEHADGVIIASSPHSHATLAQFYMDIGIPVLIEKPVTLSSSDAKTLLETAIQNRAIAFAGHTRLYSTAWREFRELWVRQGVESVYAVAGGKNKIPALWDWGPHLVAMCIDIGFDPRKAHIVCNDDPQPLQLTVNGKERFADVAESPMPMEVLVKEFLEAIDDGSPDYRALQMQVQIAEVLEEKAQRIGMSRLFPHAAWSATWH